MDPQPTPRPARRSAVRFTLGKEYHTMRRHLRWILGRQRLGAVRPESLGVEVATHATPLMRRLRGVDMRLQEGKVVNLHLATAAMNGWMLAPGEVFSFWRAIGRPTPRKGYRPGMILINGTLHAGTGGGLCQLSNLIHWLTLHTPLTVIERHRHNYDVFPDVDRVLPFGSGATCFYNYGDLVIRNTTSRPFQLRVEVGETDLTGGWYSDRPGDVTYRVVERAHIIRGEVWGGFTRHNVLVREVLARDGTLLGEEFMLENHAIMMYSPLLPPAPV
ncbi:MAG: VanW family protein [Bifidobacteriaceae bacterium]|jgi:vancomycin resistance protein VanW|nr:VanW family protein [Bifidobacteriaceae bacterium]